MAAVLTVSKLIDLAEQQYGTRYLVDRTTILMYLNVLQQMGFDKDLDVFVNYTSYLTITVTIVFESAGYTPAIIGDITKAIAGPDGAATLVSYDNATFTWVVTMTSGSFAAANALTIPTGTGAGTVASVTINRTYSAPSDCRFIQGVTSMTDLALLYPNPYLLYSTLPGQGSDDMGMPLSVFNASSDNDRFKFITGRINNMSNTFTFLTDPSTDPLFYRMFYYINPPEIEDEDDDVHMLIPDTLRYAFFVAGVGVLAQIAIYGGDQKTMMAPILDGLWNALGAWNEPTPGQNNRSNAFL